MQKEIRKSPFMVLQEQPRGTHRRVRPKRLCKSPRNTKIWEREFLQYIFCIASPTSAQNLPRQKIGTFDLSPTISRKSPTSVSYIVTDLLPAMHMYTLRIHEIVFTECHKFDSLYIKSHAIINDAHAHCMKLNYLDYKRGVPVARPRVEAGDITITIVMTEAGFFSVCLELLGEANGHTPFG
jgi:hypothetical protein